MILQSSLIVVQQILLLFLLIGVGYLCAHFNILNKDAAKQLTNLLLIVITPAMIINAFQISGNQMQPKLMLISAGVGLISHLFGILLGHLVFHGEDPERKRVLLFSTVFFNAGFFGLPLVENVFGELALAYVSIIVALFYVVLWTYGVFLFDLENGKPTIKSLLNPGTLTVVLVIFLFLLKIELPKVVLMPINEIAKLRSPLAMIIMGVQFYLYRDQFSLKNKDVWKTFLLRNLLVPILVVPLLLLVSRDETFVLACTMAAATPTAVNTVLFATRFQRDVNLAIQVVLLTTLMAIFTIPLITILTRWLLTL